jgi:hypothetical protein
VSISEASEIAVPSRAREGIVTVPDRLLIASWVVGYAALLRAFRLIKRLEAGGTQQTGR